MKVEDIAFTHSGDKGDCAAVSVFVYRSDDWPYLRKTLTIDRVSAAFRDLVIGSIVRHELASLGGLNFEMSRALGGGKFGGLRLDGMAKTFQSLMLTIELDD